MYCNTNFRKLVNAPFLAILTQFAIVAIVKARPTADKDDSEPLYIRNVKTGQFLVNPMRDWAAVTKTEQDSEASVWKLVHEQDGFFSVRCEHSLFCLDSNAQGNLYVTKCQKDNPHQRWKISTKSGKLLFSNVATKRFLDANLPDWKPYTRAANDEEGNVYQQWDLYTDEEEAEPKIEGFGGEGCGGDDSAKFNREALTKHNEYRKAHHSKPMTTSDQLIGYAQETANRMASGAQGFEHDGARLDKLSIGENLYAIWGSGFSINGASAIESWYDEVKQPGYDFGSPGFSHGTGHFTQVVWDSSIEVGCGAAKAKTDGKCYVVCNYSTRGNVRGQFPENVRRP